MRVGNALLVAGIVIVITALSGASFAADDGGRQTPEADVVATDEATGDTEPSGEESEPAPPTGDEDGRVPDEVETEEVAPEEDGDRGDGGRKESGGNGGKDRDDGGEGDKQPLADVGVTMKNIQFKPKSITIKPGDEVTWTNRDTAQHDAVANDGSFKTSLLSKGQTATEPFNTAGTFDYTCSVHPSMKGKVVVSSGDSGGSGGTSSGTGGTSSGTGSTGTSSGGFDSGTSSGSATGTSPSGSLPNTGQAELPLLLLGASLIVIGLLARAFREHWIWR